jgi:bis(5'-adenosyl)-triphosphatase
MGRRWLICMLASFFGSTTLISKRHCVSAFPRSIVSNSRTTLSTASIVIMSASASDSSSSDAQFGKFVIPAASVFYRSPEQAVASVNLRPIVPGHVLVIPFSIVPEMKDLTESEYLDMWSTVRVVQDVLRKQYKCTAFNVAVQDGRAAGQSVPHVHVHILPRYESLDFERNDQVYDELEQWAPRPDIMQGVKAKLEVPDDSERRDRTLQEMADEAAEYRKIVESTK